MRLSLQPIHTLVNPVPVSISTQALPVSDPYWLAMVQEFALEVACLLQQLTRCQQESGSKKPSQLTRLERSFAITRVQSYSKDSTSGVAHFLETLGQALCDWVQQEPQSSTAQQVRFPLITAGTWEANEGVRTLLLFCSSSCPTGRISMTLSNRLHLKRASFKHI